MGGDHARTTGNIVCIRNPFYIAIAEKLREVRGYDAIGGEVFAVGLVAYGMFLFLQWLGDWLWTRRQ